MAAMTAFSEPWLELGKAAQGPPFVLIDSAGLPGGKADIPLGAFARVECLFAGDLADELQDVAPYLAQLPSYDEECRRVAERLLAQHTGLLVVPEASEAPDAAFAQLHRHFRKFNVVYGAAGKPMFFRYYDPRVLLDVLAVFDPEQLQQFFAPLQRILLSGPDGRAVTCYRHAGKLEVRVAGPDKGSAP